MKIVVTGASSFIGLRLISKLRGDGHDVVPIGRKESVRWELGEPLPFVERPDALIHLAFDRTRSVLDSLRDNQMITNSFSGRTIYLSTMSAHKDSKSGYGRRKYIEECHFISIGATVLKVGLVVDRKAEGVFGKLLGIVGRIPIIPLPLKGQSHFYISNIEDLINEISESVISPRSGLIRASSESGISLKDLLEKISNGLGVSRRFILIPKYPLHLFLILLTVFSKKLSLIDSYFSMTEEIPAIEVNEFSPPITNFTDFNLDGMV